MELTIILVPFDYGLSGATIITPFEYGHNRAVFITVQFDYSQRFALFLSTWQYFFPKCIDGGHNTASNRVCYHMKLMVTVA